MNPSTFLKQFYGSPSNGKGLTEVLNKYAKVMVNLARFKDEMSKGLDVYTSINLTDLPTSGYFIDTKLTLENFVNINDNDVRDYVTRYAFMLSGHDTFLHGHNHHLSVAMHNDDKATAFVLSSLMSDGSIYNISTGKHETI